MFLRATPSSTPGLRPHLANAYQQVGMETGVSTASPHRLVLMLLDGVLDAVRQARQAMVDGDIPRKCHEITRAVHIIDEGLKSALDLAAGGVLAARLHDLYAYTLVRLTAANLHNDASALDEVEHLLQPVHEAWVAIGAEVARASDIR